MRRSDQAALTDWRETMTKHQPCGKPGCLNCWPAMPSDPAQAPMQNMLTPREIELRNFIISQGQAYQNFAPGSPLYDRIMGTRLYEQKPMAQEDESLWESTTISMTHRKDQQAKNRLLAEMVEQVQRQPIPNSSKPARTSHWKIYAATLLLGFAIGVFAALITLAVQS